MSNARVIASRCPEPPSLFVRGTSPMADGNSSISSEKLSCGRGTKCDPHVLIAALLSSGGCVTDAASRTGISERTLRRRLKNAEFSRLYRAKKEEASRESISRIAGLAGEALETLRASLTSPDELNRIFAALGILEFALQDRSLARQACQAVLKARRREIQERCSEAIERTSEELFLINARLKEMLKNEQLDSTK